MDGKHLLGERQGGRGSRQWCREFLWEGRIWDDRRVFLHAVSLYLNLGYILFVDIKVVIQRVHILITLKDPWALRCFKINLSNFQCTAM